MATLTLTHTTYPDADLLLLSHAFGLLPTSNMSTIADLPPLNILQLP